MYSAFSREFSGLSMPFRRNASVVMGASLPCHTSSGGTPAATHNGTAMVVTGSPSATHRVDRVGSCPGFTPWMTTAAAVLGRSIV